MGGVQDAELAKAFSGKRGIAILDADSMDLLSIENWLGEVKMPTLSGQCEKRIVGLERIQPSDRARRIFHWNR